MFVSIILGSNKTTVTVGTGDIKYHPLYFSVGNIQNSVWRAHRNTIIPIGFWLFRKVCSLIYIQSSLDQFSYSLDDCKYDKDPAFCKFKRQLYHSSISAILSTLKPTTSTPAVYCCPNGHFRCVVFKIGPFIADYPEQVMLAGVKQGWCPRCVFIIFCS